MKFTHLNPSIIPFLRRDGGGDEEKRKAYDRSLGKPDDIIVEEAVTLEKLDKQRLDFVLNTKALCADCNGTGENPNPKACTNCALPPGLRTLSYSYKGDHEQPEARCQMCDRRCTNIKCKEGFQKMSGVRVIDIDVAMLRKREITLYASLSDHDLVTDMELPSNSEFPYKISVKTLDGPIHDILIRVGRIKDGIFFNQILGCPSKAVQNRGDSYVRLWQRHEEPYN
ncbi:unnamed protein product [Orchesella dallaii]|uniref:Uncharacterized protein n=1 Tax=Orchesella dallaii TaxID=48710 RepID=A0ABP1QCZ5_9HEXA